MKKNIILLISILTLLLPLNSLLARDKVNDWYIKDYFIIYKINLDSSIEVVEKITADCGDNLRHGIYRVIDRNGIVVSDVKVKDHKSKISTNSLNVSIKIGDPNVYVRGENYYEISYTIANAIKNHDDYSEFYYNILGHSWDLEIDNFRSQIIFPEGLNKDNVKLSLYSGILAQTDNQLANYRWLNDNTLEVYSLKPYLANQGITLSASFPQGIINIEIKDAFRGLQVFALLLIPLIILPFIFLFILWRIFKKHQKKNPYYKKTIVPQYEAPDNLSPIKLGFLVNNGNGLGKLITATIIHFASLKLITIADKEQKGLFINDNTLEFKKTTNQANYHELDEIEKHIFDLIFKDKEIVETKDLRRILLNKTREIYKKVKVSLQSEDYLNLKTPPIKMIYGIIAIIFFLLMSPIAAIVMFFFFLSITNRTEKGERVAWENKGFLMFLKIAKQDRHRFYEKENIFTKLLPYAIAFNLTSHFLKEMASIYGEEQIKTSMTWYAGYSSLHSIDGLSTKLNSISSQISSSTSSGGGGMGSSGGGRGGGGGGGW